MSDTMTREAPQQTVAPLLPPAGWYADPADQALLRWWGGLAWTDHTRVVVTAPAAESVETPASGYRPLVSNYIQHGSSDGHGWNGTVTESPQPSSGNTVAIWLLALYPIIYYSIIAAVLVLQLAPALYVGIALAVFVLIFVVAGADHAALSRRGLPAPSVAWLLLSIPVYLIRRRIVLKRAGVKSNAPGNVFALQFFAGFVLSYFAYGTIAGAQRDTAAVHRLEAQTSAELLRESKVSWTVACPAEAPASTTGATFNCDATSANGQKAVIVATVVSPDRFTVKLAGAPSSSLNS